MCKDCEICVHYPICEWCAENADFKFPEENGICEMFKPDTETKKPTTKAGLIRQMSDEQLAEEFSLIAGWDRKEYEKAKQIGIKKVMLEWLKQPADMRGEEE